jgi:hypothetical protein
MCAASIHSTRWLLALIILAQVFVSLPLEVNSATQDVSIPVPPVTLTAEQDHKRILDQGAAFAAHEACGPLR